MTKEENYLVLRHKLTNSSCPHYILNILKEHFREKIDSDRRLDRIISLLDLIKILEKRDVINLENIGSLMYIALRLDRDDIVEYVNNFNVTPQVEPTPEVTCRVLPRTNPDPIQRVYDLICMEIGQKWKEFARALKVQEGSIDQLEIKHRNNISEMVREVITYHKDQCDPNYWRVELSNALVKARRRDLSQAIERIFAMHGL